MWLMCSNNLLLSHCPSISSTCIKYPLSYLVFLFIFTQLTHLTLKTSSWSYSALPCIIHPLEKQTFRCPYKHILATKCQGWSKGTTLTTTKFPKVLKTSYLGIKWEDTTKQYRGKRLEGVWLKAQHCDKTAKISLGKLKKQCLERERGQESYCAVK